MHANEIWMQAAQTAHGGITAQTAQTTQEVYKHHDPPQISFLYNYHRQQWELNWLTTRATRLAPTTVVTSVNALLTALKVASAPLGVLRPALVCLALVPVASAGASPAANKFEAGWWLWNWILKYSDHELWKSSLKKNPHLLKGDWAKSVECWVLKLSSVRINKEITKQLTLISCSLLCETS